MSRPPDDAARALSPSCLWSCGRDDVRALVELEDVQAPQSPGALQAGLPPQMFEVPKEPSDGDPNDKGWYSFEVHELPEDSDGTADESGPRPPARLLAAACGAGDAGTEEVIARPPQEPDPRPPSKESTGRRQRHSGRKQDGHHHHYHHHDQQQPSQPHRYGLAGFFHGPGAAALAPEPPRPRPEPRPRGDGEGGEDGDSAGESSLYSESYTSSAAASGRFNRMSGSRLFHLFARSETTNLSDIPESQGRVVCVPSKYSVPTSVVRKVLQKLDAALCPGSPGELRAKQVLRLLGRFDDYFDSGRCAEARDQVVESLDRSSRDFTRVRWNDERLLKAFCVPLNIQERVYFTIDVGDSSTLMSRIVSAVMIIAIVLSITLWMAGTMREVATVQCDGCSPEPEPWMLLIDELCVLIFTAEYVTRLLTVSSVRFELLRSAFVVELLVAKDESELPRKRTGCRKLWSFVISPTALCDLATVLPFWLELAFQESHANFPFLRLFRILRVSRVFKLFRLLNSDLGSLTDVQNLLKTVVQEALPAAVMTAGLICCALLVFSSLMYTVEHGAWYPHELLQHLAATETYRGPVDKGQFVRVRPDGIYEVSPYTSIPASAWWTLQTITTVGYGDVYPVSVPGKVVACVAILYGTILLGLPIGIIGSQFSTEYGRMVTQGRRRQEAARQKQERNFVGQQGPEDAPATASSEDPVNTPKWQTALCKAKTRLSQVATSFTPGRFDSSTTKVNVSSATEKLIQLPLPPEDKELLHVAKMKFEDAIQMHGEHAGITVEVQSRWNDDLMTTFFTAGPALDMLGMRVLSMVAEAEHSRPSASYSCQKIRQAWHELCIVSCHVAELVEAASEQTTSEPAVSEQARHRERDLAPSGKVLRPEDDGVGEINSSSPASTTLSGTELAMQLERPGVRLMPL